MKSSITTIISSTFWLPTTAGLKRLNLPKNRSFKKLRLLGKTWLFAVVLIGAGACQNHATPRPRGYFHIQLPEKNYTLLDSVLPYSFEYPAFARIENDLSPQAEPYWIRSEERRVGKEWRSREG